MTDSESLTPAAGGHNGAGSRGDSPNDAERPEQTEPGSTHRSGLASLSIRRPIGTIMLGLVVLVLGVYFMTGLSLDLLPSIVYPSVRAGVTNSGVAPEVLEETVAKPLENALASTEDVVQIETEVQEGRVGVNLHFRYGTNIDFALQDASKNLDRARGSLPVEADPPTIFKFDPSQIAIYQAAFSSNALNLVQLRDWIDNRLRPQLLTIEGVASLDVAGGLVREIHVVLDQERLRSYGLTVAQVIDAIRSQNQDIAAGRVASFEREVVGKTEGRFRSVDDVRNLMLSVPERGRIPLTEVAQVLDTHEEERLWARLDGVPAVQLSVRKQPDANTVRVADQVEARLVSLRESGFIPPEVEFVTIENQASFIRESLAAVRDAAMFGAVLAMLVVLLFLGSLRKTFIVGIAIPLAILSTFVMMGLGNLTLNIMSLGGLALGVGLLIDNSIVMLENIFRQTTDFKRDPENAAHEGAHEVTGAVIASTATNLAAVVPFLLISGLAVLIFRELILTISFAIIASLCVALTLVPMLSAQLAKVRFTSGIERWRPVVAFDRAIEWLRQFYRRLARRMIPWRWAVLGASFAALGAVFFATRNLGNEFLPQVDDGNVRVNLNLPPGTSAEQTNLVAFEVEEITRTMPHIHHIFTTAGGRIFGSSTAAQAGRGSMTIVLSPRDERSISANEWVQELQQKIDDRGFAGARIWVSPPRIRGLRTSRSGDDAVSIMVQGEELDELQRAADEIMTRIADVPGLSNVRPSTDEANPLIAITLDRERASYLGLDVAQLGNTLRTAMDGTIATQYTEGNREYDVRVMMPRSRFQSAEDIGAIALYPGVANGAPIYVRDVANVESKLGPTTIRRENQNRIIRVSGDMADDTISIGEVNAEVRQRLADLSLPEGYTLMYGGEEEAIRESNRQLAIVVTLAIFLVFVVLAVQFESFVNPFVIILTIPLSLIGVGLALAITATPMSAPVMLGVILLAGIVVNNAILLVEFIEQRRRAGASREEAVIEAGAVRLRPILMTTVTTAAGMLPLAIGLGAGTELMGPLAISVVGGISLAMFVTLFVIPSAYLIINSGAETVHAWLTGAARVTAAVPAAAPVSTPAPAPETVEVLGD